MHFSDIPLPSRKDLTTTESRGRREIEQSQIGPKDEEAGAPESKSTEDSERDFWVGRPHHAT